MCLPQQVVSSLCIYLGWGPAQECPRMEWDHLVYEASCGAILMGPSWTTRQLLFCDRHFGLWSAYRNQAEALSHQPERLLTLISFLSFTHLCFSYNYGKTQESPGENTSGLLGPGLRSGILNLQSHCIVQSQLHGKKSRIKVCIMWCWRPWDQAEVYQDVLNVSLGLTKLKLGLFLTLGPWHLH